MIINNFKVAKYNIYNIPVNSKQWTCPLCSESRKKKTDKCMTLHWDSGLGKCHHCGEVIQLHEWEKKKEHEKYKIPTNYNQTELSDKLVEWFAGRKIDQFILRLMKISEGLELMPDKKEWKQKNTVQYPYIRHGEVINIKYRSGDKAFKMFKEAEKIPYNLDNVSGQELVYWVEGEMDVLAVMQCGIHNVTSPPNGFTLPNKDGISNINLDYLDNSIDSFKNTQKFILAFDNDEAGQNGFKEFVRRFGAHKCFKVDLKDCKDSNEYLIKYGAEELKKALEDYKEIPLDNISYFNDHKIEVRDFFLHGMPKGIVTGTMPELDAHFSVNKGHTVLITGIPSHGKSELVDSIICGYALNYDFKIAIASVENKPNALHAQKIIRKIFGITPKRESDFNKGYELCEQFMQDHFYFIDIDLRYDLETVLRKAEELVFRKGINCLVIDPYNKVRLTGSIPSITGNKVNDYTSEYLNKINEFGYKYDIINLLVAHPIKLGKDAIGKRVIPDFYDVKGGGEFYDMCHHGLVVYKDKMLNSTLIRTLKVKFANLGTSDMDTYWQYNINNGRYTPIQDPNNTPPNPIWDNSNWLLKKPENKIPIQSEMDLKPNKTDWYDKENKEFDNYMPDGIEAEF